MNPAYTNWIGRAKRLLPLLVIAFAALPKTIIAAEPPTGTIRATRIRSDETFVLDGRIEDAAWQRAAPAHGFLQREPEEGGPATERTEVRILYDDDRLYLGIICYDRDPQAIVATEMSRDSDLGSDDSFSFVLDTFGDRRSAYLFGTNPLGARYDGIASGISDRIDTSWDGVWDVYAEVNDEGWSAEVAIPFKTLRFKRGERQEWGINFKRNIQRRNEEDLWRAHMRNQGLTRLVHAGVVEGLDLAAPPSRIEFRPYLASGLQKPTGAPVDRELKGGLDLKYGVTPNLNLDVTLNTDFSQAEVDQNQINLTRFSLFFPEKREFFIEGSNYFDFGQGGQLQPFHSRRIGLSAQRQQIPILVGGRLTGKVGRTGIGGLVMQTREDEGEPSTLFSTLRLQRDLFSQSSIGFLIADREPLEGNANRTFGADFTLATSKLLGDRNLTVSGFFFGTQTPDTPDGWAGSVLIDYPNDLWRINVRHTEIEGDINPETGFVKRRGIRRTNGEFKVAPRPRLPGIRQLFFKVKFDYLLDRQNVLQNRDFEIRLLGIDSQWGDEFELNFQPRFERFNEDFEIVGGLLIPSGSYTFNQWEIQLKLSDIRPISSKIKFFRGEYFTGDRTAWKTTTTVRLGSHLSMTTAFDRNDIRVDGESFVTNELSGRVSYAVTTNLALRAFAQWNNEDDEVNLNLRLSFLPSSGNKLFLVYNQLWDREALKWRTAERAVLLKTV